MAKEKKETPEEKRQARIRQIMDNAAALLEREKVKYFVAVVDKDPKASDGGKAYVQSDVTGEDFTHILDMALPTRQDVINLGIWVGQLITARNKQQ